MAAEKSSVVTEHEMRGHVEMPDSPPPDQTDKGTRKALHCWIDGGVSDRLRRYSDVNGVKIQHIAERALDAYLTERGA
jgi:hypothetical protein